MSFIDKHILQSPGIEHRVCRQRQLAAERDIQFEIDEHVGLKSEIGIGEFHAHFGSPRLRIKRRRDEDDPALPPGKVGTVGQFDLNHLTEFQDRQIGFIHLAENPHAGKIHDRVQVHFRSDVSAVMVSLPVRHNSSDR